MPFLPNSTKPRAIHKQSTKSKKSSLMKMIAIRLGFALFATASCVAILNHSTTKFFNSVVASAQASPQPNQNLVPPALTAAESLLKSMGCSPMSGARIESQNLPKGIVRDPSATMAIALTGICKNNVKALIAFQSSAGQTFLSDPMFKTVSIVKLGLDGTIHVKATVGDEKVPRDFDLVIANQKLVIK